MFGMLWLEYLSKAIALNSLYDMLINLPKKQCKTSYMFCAAFLVNLYSNLSYKLYRKFPICFAQLFLAILCNNLSYFVI